MMGIRGWGDATDYAFLDAASRFDLTYVQELRHSILWKPTKMVCWCALTTLCPKGSGDGIKLDIREFRVGVG